VRHFIGGGVELNESELASTSSERYRLKTIPSGSVTVELGIVLKNFETFGVQT
jgi:B9 domain-containing protein 2